ncbi:MAG TPA: hypothetical protein VFB81_05955 [Myxococcales bacterium]|nr:hypothetical protein [Myxococcales bacterium]
MSEVELNEAEREMLLAADVVVEEAQQNVATAATSGDSRLIWEREMELKVAFEWAHLVREEVKAGKLRENGA